MLAMGIKLLEAEICRRAATLESLFMRRIVTARFKCMRYKFLIGRRASPKIWLYPTAKRCKYPWEVKCKDDGKPFPCMSIPCFYSGYNGQASTQPTSSTVWARPVRNYHYKQNAWAGFETTAWAIRQCFVCRFLCVRHSKSGASVDSVVRLVPSQRPIFFARL